MSNVNEAEQITDHMAERKVDPRYGIERFSKSREEFIHYYESELAEKINELEAERKKLVSSIIKKGIICAIIAIAAIIIGFIFSQNLVFLVVILAVFYLVFDTSRNKKKIEPKLKEEVIRELVTFMNPNFTYEPNRYLSKQLFRHANIFSQNPDEYTGDDLIKGYVFDEEENARTNIAFSEVKAVKVTVKRDQEGKKKEERETIFQGLFFKVEFNKDFGDSLTTVVPKGIRFGKGIRSFVGKISSKMSGEKFLEDVELEDPEFMDKFLVRSTDQIEARVVLQADFMKRLIDFVDNKPEPLNDETSEDVTDYSMGALQKAAQIGLNAASQSRAADYKPYFSFRNNDMYFLLETGRSHFDFNMFQKLNVNTVYGYFTDINRALQIIDDLNLNLKLYKE